MTWGRGGLKCNAFQNRSADVGPEELLEAALPAAGGDGAWLRCGSQEEAQVHTVPTCAEDARRRRATNPAPPTRRPSLTYPLYYRTGFWLEAPKALVRWLARGNIGSSRPLSSDF